MFQNFNLLGALIRLPGILLGFTFHEYAHAYMATRFGDHTPELDGRLTANPFAHIDIWGLLLILFAGFGWAKPVRTNPSYYRGNIRQKDLIVSISGPIANFILAFISAFILVLILKLGILKNLSGTSLNILVEILDGVIWINCVLFIFNLIPIPPLDGYHILLDIFPRLPYNFVYTVERYSYIILFIFILTPISDIIVGNGANLVYGIISRFVMMF